MSEPRKSFFWLAGIAGFAVVIAATALVLELNRDRIAVVRTGDLVAKYKGMEDARSSFEEQKKNWQHSIDTLEGDYRQSVNDLNAEWSGLSGVERKKREELIETQKENIIRYGRGLETQVREQQEELWEEVLSQVNDAVRDYAREQGYDVILGATMEGSILYSEEYLDITDELIEVLNRKYEHQIKNTDNEKQDKK